MKLITLYIILNVQKILCIVPLSQFYPFGPAAGDTRLPNANNDGVGPISLSVHYPFFGTNKTSLYVDVNGAITFNSILYQYTPTCTPYSSGFGIVMPYFCDIDTTYTGNSSSIWYRQTTSADVLNQATIDISKAFPSQFCNISMTWAFVTTWYNVTFWGYGCSQPSTCAGNYDCAPRNTFQSVLTTDGVHSFAIFYYNNLTWTTACFSGCASSCTGMASSGGYPTRVGFDAGDGVNYLNAPNSCTNSIVNISMNSNVGNNGVFVYRVDSNTNNNPEQTNVTCILTTTTTSTSTSTTTTTPEPTTTSTTSTTSTTTTPAPTTTSTTSTTSTTTPTTTSTTSTTSTTTTPEPTTTSTTSTTSITTPTTTSTTSTTSTTTTPAPTTTSTTSTTSTTTPTTTSTTSTTSTTTTPEPTTTSTTSTTSKTTTTKPTTTTTTSIPTTTTLAPVCCPAQGVWSQWSNPSGCNDTCGACGVATRQRYCLTEGNGCPCTGNDIQNVPCNLSPCKYPRNSCCIGKAKVINGSIICNVSIPIETSTSLSCTTVSQSTLCCPSGGTWSEWSTSQTCSDSCGSCSQLTYTRTCTSIPTCPCAGSSSKTVNCNLTPCKYPRNSCCGSYKVIPENGQVICGPQPVEPTVIPSASMVCTTVPGVVTGSTTCAPDGEWSSWTQGTCSDTCGMCGTQINTRTCLSQSRGCPCSGASSESVACAPTDCKYPRATCCSGYASSVVDGSFVCVPKNG